MQTITHVNNGKTFLLVEIGDAKVFRTFENMLLYDLEIMTLPSGNYTIIGKADQISKPRFSFSDYKSIVQAIYKNKMQPYTTLILQSTPPLQ